MAAGSVEHGAVKQYYKEVELAYGIGENSVQSNVGGYKVFIQNISVASEGEAKTYKDNAGQTTAIVLPERYQVLTCDGLLIKGENSDKLPEKGDEVTNIPSVAGLATGNDVTWRLETIQVAWANEEVARVSMTIREYKF